MGDFSIVLIFLKFDLQVSCEAEGREWSPSTSAARNYTPSFVAPKATSSKLPQQSAIGSYYGGHTQGSQASYADGGGYNSESGNSL